MSRLVLRSEAPLRRVVRAGVEGTIHHFRFTILHLPFCEAASGRRRGPARRPRRIVVREIPTAHVVVSPGVPGRAGASATSVSEWQRRTSSKGLERLELSAYRVGPGRRNSADRVIARGVLRYSIPSGTGTSMACRHATRVQETGPMDRSELRARGRRAQRGGRIFFWTPVARTLSWRARQSVGKTGSNPNQGVRSWHGKQKWTDVQCSRPAGQPSAPVWPR